MRTRSSLATGILFVPLAALAQAATQPVPADHPPMGMTAPGSPNPHARTLPSPWALLGDYTLTAKVPPKGETGTWKFRTFADPADVIVELDTPGPKGRIKGSILLLGGQAIAARGFALEPGFEIDPLDIAIVNLKILTRLLDEAVPGGPDALKGRQAVDARDDKSPIVVSTPSANARFNAPWSLKGNVERIDASTLSFTLEVDATVGDKPAARARWTFAGRASGTQKDRVMDASMSMTGWTAYELGPVKSAKPGAHMSLRFGATRLPGPFATLKDLRAALP